MILNYLSGPNVNTRVLIREGPENHSQGTRCDDGSRIWRGGERKRERDLKIFCHQL